MEFVLTINRVLRKNFSVADIQKGKVSVWVCILGSKPIIIDSRQAINAMCSANVLEGVGKFSAQTGIVTAPEITKKNHILTDIDLVRER